MNEQNILLRNINDSIFNKQESGWEKSKNSLSELVEKIRAKNAKPVIVFIPFIEILEDRETSDQKLKLIKEFAKEKNVPVIDPSDAIVEIENKGKKLYYRTFDTHTNAQGDEVIAEEISKNWDRIGD